MVEELLLCGPNLLKHPQTTAVVASPHLASIWRMISKPT